MFFTLLPPNFWHFFSSFWGGGWVQKGGWHMFYIGRISFILAASVAGGIETESEMTFNEPLQ